MIENKIICADVMDGIKQIDDNTVSLILTSPPYNVKEGYDNSNDNLLHKDYIAWLYDVLILTYDKMKSGGRLVINIDAVTNRQEDKNSEYLRPIYSDIVSVCKEIGYLFYTEICWYKQNAVGRATAWGSWCSSSFPIIRRNHEYILVFSKEKWKLDGDDELSDMTPEEFAQYTLSTWHIKPETRKLCGHPCPFPEELAERIIKLFSYRDNLVLDIFNGVGTTTAVADRLGRRYIGIDNCEKYCNFAKERILKNKLLIEDKYVPRSQRLIKYKENKTVSQSVSLL